MTEAGCVGPAGERRAVVLSFDNLGEAAELQRGTWLADGSAHEHPSISRALPRLLDELDHHRLRATFFVEAINCERHPQAVREIAAAGHELGVHGWCHEPWSELPADEERASLKRSTDAFAALGVQARAFRPPGGELTGQTEALLAGLGYAWCSPGGGGSATIDGVGLVRVPFDWEHVDAYHLMDRFADLRAGRGDARAALTPEQLTARLTDALVHGEGLQTVIMHPFLMLDDEWWDGVRQVLAVIAGLGSDGDAWVVPGGRLASSLIRRG